MARGRLRLIQEAFGAEGCAEQRAPAGRRIPEEAARAILYGCDQPHDDGIGGQYGKTELAGRQYALSASGGDGELPAPGGKAEYYHSGMDRNHMQYACNGIDFRPPERYSYDIIKETGEFVINLTTEKLTYATDFCGVRSGRDIDKFKAAHLTPIPGVHVSAPLIEESPVNIECRVKDVIELGSHHMFLADVLGVSVDEAYMDEKGKFDMNRAGMMVYSHGEYFGLGKQLGTFGYSVRKTKK